MATYFSIVDSIGHSYGPDADETIEAIRDVDKAIGHLIDGLEAQNILNEVNIMIVSDHGMTETPDTKVINIADYINLDDVVTIGGGPFMEIRPNEDKLESVYQALQNIDNTQVFKKEDIPEKFHYKNNDRIEPILLLADEHWSITAFKSEFSGPEIQLVHLYEMMCKILDITPARNDGSLDVGSVFLKD